jgi:hypothetical protein
MRKLKSGYLDPFTGNLRGHGGPRTSHQTTSTQPLSSEQTLALKFGETAHSRSFNVIEGKSLPE